MIIFLQIIITVGKKLFSFLQIKKKLLSRYQILFYPFSGKISEQNIGENEACKTNLLEKYRNYGKNHHILVQK
jgi:hypothetical protein